MSDGKILSQAEIDALMNSNDDDEGDSGNQVNTLTEEEKDVLGEVGNIAMGSAATALYTLLDKKVEITTPEVSVVTFDDVIEEYDRPCVLVSVEYIAGLEGSNLLIIKAEDAAIIADLMMGGDGTDPDEQLDEIRTSAVGEAMNQMMGSASTSLSSIIGDLVNISPPVSKHLSLDQAIDDDDINFDEEDLLVETSFQLKIGDLVDSSFKQLAPLEFTKRLVANLTNIESGGLTAKEELLEEEIEQEEPATVADMKQQVQAKARAQQQQEEPVQQTAPQQDSAQQQRREVAASYTGSRDISHDPVGVQRAQFPDFDNAATAALPQNMELIHDVPLQVTVRLGKSKMTIKEILDLGEGSIVELDKLAGEPVDLLVNGKLVAKGEVVVIDENFGFRVKDIISPMERINNL
ncbi:MAG: flagellar motor switch phosphatase FliY [Halanaerobiales bacterium]